MKERQGSTRKKDKVVLKKKLFYFKQNITSR